MNIQGPGNMPSTSPLAPSAGTPASQDAPGQASRVATDQLSLASGGPTAAQALATIEHARLPERGWMLLTHHQQDAWVSQGAGVVRQAYDALQQLEANQQDPLKAIPRAQLDAAREKVMALGGEVAKHDPRNVRRGAIEDTVRDLNIAIHAKMTVGEPPPQGTLTKEQWAQAKATWVKEKSAQLESARPLIERLGDLEDAFREEAFTGPMLQDLKQKQAALPGIANPGPTNWGKLISDVVTVGGALAHEVSMDAGAMPLGPIAVRPDGQVIPNPRH